MCDPCTSVPGCVLVRGGHTTISLMRVCPKCGDYYDEADPLFCKRDESALINVKPGTDTWNEGERVLEEKDRARRQQIGRTSRRRFWAIAIASVVILIVMAAWYSARYGTNTKEEPAPSPVAGTLTPTATPTPSSTPSPTCSAADQENERQLITKRYSEEFTVRIINDSTEVIVGKLPAGTRWVEPRLIESLTRITFSSQCSAATVTVAYKWQVLANIEGVQKPTLVDGRHRFQCSKTGTQWRCN